MHEIFSVTFANRLETCLEQLHDEDAILITDPRGNFVVLSDVEYNIMRDALALGLSSK